MRSKTVEPNGVFICKTSLIIALMGFWALIFVSITSVHGAVTFTPNDQFVIPEYNSWITFAVGGSYEYASLENNTWNFVRLALDNYVLNLTAVYPYVGVVKGRDVLNYSRNDGNFSASAQNCNIKITNYDLITRGAPKTGWLNYTVTGTGTQTFNLHYTWTIDRPDNWIVYIDGVAKAQNDSWSISSDDWLTVSSSNCNVSIHYERTPLPRNDLDQEYPLLMILSVGAIVVIIMIIITIILIRVNRKKTEKKTRQWFLYFS